MTHIASVTERAEFGRRRWKGRRVKNEKPFSFDDDDAFTIRILYQHEIRLKDILQHTSRGDSHESDANCISHSTVEFHLLTWLNICLHLISQSICDVVMREIVIIYIAGYPCVSSCRFSKKITIVNRDSTNKKDKHTSALHLRGKMWRLKSDENEEWSASSTHLLRLSRNHPFELLSRVTRAFESRLLQRCL